MRAKLASGIASPPLNQRVAERFLSEGGYGRHLRILRGRLTAQRTRLRQAILQAFPADTRVTDPRGGFLLWVELPDPIDVLALYRRARSEGLSFLPGPLCAVDGGFDRHLRLAAGHPVTNEVLDGVERLGALVRDYWTPT